MFRDRTDAGDHLAEALRQRGVEADVATGATMRACLQHVRDERPARVVVAVPVGPRDSIEELREFADEVVALETPAAFRSVGAYFENLDK